MAKIMAEINEESAVISMLWCADYQKETDQLKDIGGRAVGTGDIYKEGKWYSPDGTEILTELEIAQREIERLNAEKAQLEAAYREGVNSI